jgi:hypothetical protein
MKLAIVLATLLVPVAQVYHAPSISHAAPPSHVERHNPVAHNPVNAPSAGVSRDCRMAQNKRRSWCR